MHAPRALVHRYARSLFLAASDQNALDEVHRDLREIDHVWAENPEFTLMVENPGLARPKVRAMLMALADRLEAHVLTRNLLLVLLEKDRLEIVRDLFPHFDRLWVERRGEIEMTVTTAVPVSEELRERIRAHLSSRSGRTPTIRWNENPALLGGVVVEWSDRIFDGSLSRKLANLTAHLSGTI